MQLHPEFVVTAPSQESKKTRSNVILAIAHALLALVILGVFVYTQASQ